MKNIFPLILLIFLTGCQETDSLNISPKICPTHELPDVHINTDNVSIYSKEEYVDGSIEIIGAGNLEGLDTQPMKIKGRGNSTWWLGETYGKKPYQIKFSDKTAVLGMPEDKKWVLLAELSDKSLIRNKISRDLSRFGGLDYTPRLEFVNLILNDEPQGVYLLGQKVEESDNRVAIGDDGYLIEIDNFDRIDSDDVFFTSDAFTSVFPTSVLNIKEPNVDANSPEYDLIKNHIAAFEEALFSSEFTSTSGYRAFIDVDSFIAWFLVNEIAKTQDAKWYSSIFFSYIPGGKIKMGPVWDFDLSYGNVDYSDAQNAEGFWVKENPWIKRLFEDPVFEEEVRKKYDQYYANLSNIISDIDCYASYLETSQELNYQIWETLGVKVWPNPVWYDTYQEEVDQFKGWISTRMEWLNNTL